MDVRAAPATYATAGGVAHVRFTSRAEGDFNADLVPAAVLEARRRAVVDLPWTMLREVHGPDVVVVERPGEHDGATADAAVTTLPGTVLGLWVGDCAPVALIGASGVLGVAHAGWRGVRAGVLGNTVAAMRSLGEDEITAVVGPCIGPECYEFGTDDLRALVRRFGPDIVGTAANGRDALDMVALVRSALAEHGVPVEAHGACTGCDPSYWSHRVRGERGRQAMALWREAA